jgi:glycerate kinase
LLEGCTIVTSSIDHQTAGPPEPREPGPPPWRAARGAGISQRLLVACAPFGPRLSATSVARAIARGLTEGGLPEPDVCPLPIAAGNGEDGPLRLVGGNGGRNDEDVRGLLDALGIDARMRCARAVVVGTPLLEEGALAGSVTFEIATRARQSGVPAYAVTRENALGAFDARILDLQVILQARSTDALASAGRELARLV